jgi:hypothetical protein
VELKGFTFAKQAHKPVRGEEGAWVPVSPYDPIENELCKLHNSPLTQSTLTRLGLSRNKRWNLHTFITHVLRHLLALYGITCGNKQCPFKCVLEQVAISDSDIKPLQDAISKQGMGFSQQLQVKAKFA